MALSRVQVSILGLCAAVVLVTQNIDTRAQAQIAASNAERTTTGNPITGEGLPNPAPVVTRNWGELPAGRKWGTTAGIDVDPSDGNIWAYERCGAATAGGGPVDNRAECRAVGQHRIDRQQGRPAERDDRRSGHARDPQPLSRRVSRQGDESEFCAA